MKRSGPLRRKTPLRSKSGLSRNTRLKRTGGLSRGGRINPRNEERREKNHERAYGGEERVRWVKDMECLVPSCSLPAENAHLPGAGGMGYKGDADTVVNLCTKHHRAPWRGSLHDLGSIRAFNESWGVDLRAEAERLEERWKQKQSSD